MCTTKFHIQEHYILSADCIYAFRAILIRNWHYFLAENWLSLTEMQYVYCAVRIEYEIVIKVNNSVQLVNLLNPAGYVTHHQV